jgi:hypothetical protein
VHYSNLFKGQVLSSYILLMFVCVFLTPHAAFSQSRDYSVEVAALRSQDCAVELANGLLARGFEAYTVKANQPDYGTYYRVRIGKFRNIDIARTYAENLLDSGLLDTCAITVYDAPLSSLITATTQSKKLPSTGIFNTSISFSCPIKLPGNNPITSEDLPKDLIAAIGKNKWLLSTDQSVVYTLPSEKAMVPARDVVLLMRSIDKNRWRLRNDVGGLLTPPVPPQQGTGLPANAIDSTIATSMSSLKIAANSVSAAVKAPVTNQNNQEIVRVAGNNVPSSSQILAAATTNIPAAGRGSIPGISRTSATDAIRDMGYFAQPKLQGLLEMRDGQMLMRLKNLDLQRGFSGVARITLSDDKQNNDIAPMAIELRPNEERVVPINEARMEYGDWMLMVYDENQAVRLIRSAPFGQRPETMVASAQPQAQPEQASEPGVWRLVETPSEEVPPSGSPASGLPNVTGTFDATKTGNPNQSGNQSGMLPVNGSANSSGQGNASFENSEAPQNRPQPEIPAGQVMVSPRQIAVTPENVAIELDISSPRALGYVRVSLRSGNYRDERYALMSTPNGRVPFLIPTKEATANFNFQVQDEAGRVLSTGVGDFRQFGR